MSPRAPAEGSSGAADASLWGVAAAMVAPILLVGGWSLAAARQPPAYDPRTDTISALAAEGAADRWIMTLAFAAIGLCYLLTAVALREPAMPGRIALAAGGVATVVVACFPGSNGGTPSSHGIAATIASSAVALWPMLAARRGPHVSWPLRPVVATTVSIVLIGLLAWFVSELHGGTLAGLSERLAAGAEALWVGVAGVTLRDGPPHRRAH